MGKILKQTHNGSHKELQTYYLNLMKRTSLKTLDLSHAYQPCTKFLTLIVIERTCNFLNANNILTSEQKGCEKGSYCCKDNLLMNNMLLENSRSDHRNLSTAWIHYRKAFDSVSHTWILNVLQMYKKFSTIINLLTTCMNEWKTSWNIQD